MEKHTTRMLLWQAGIVTNLSLRCGRFDLASISRFEEIFDQHTLLQEGMAMRYNTWNMGSSAPAGGKKMEMVDSVAGVPKVFLASK